MFMLIAPMIRPGVVLSQPPSKTAPSTGVRAQQLLRLHREEIAVEHGRRLHHRLAERDRWDFDGKAAALPDAALHLLGARAQMRMARIEIAPRVEDADHRLAGEILVIVTHLQRARTVAESAHVFDTEPAVRAQLFRFLACHDSFSTPLPSTIRNFSANCATANGFDKRCVPGSSTPL